MPNPFAIYRSFLQFPKGFYILFLTESGELFGRFGITALLVLYLSHHLHMADGPAFSLMALIDM